MLDLRPRNDGGFRDSSRSVRTRSRDVTRGDGVDLLAGSPWQSVRGAWIGRRGSSDAYRGARFSKRGLAFCGECGGRAENSRAPYRNKGRERPNLPETDSKAEPRTPELLTGAKVDNARVFRRRIRRPRTLMPSKFGEKEPRTPVLFQVRKRKSSG